MKEDRIERIERRLQEAETDIEESEDRQAEALANLKSGVLARFGMVDAQLSELMDSLSADKERGSTQWALIERLTKASGRIALMELALGLIIARDSQLLKNFKIVGDALHEMEGDGTIADGLVSSGGKESIERILNVAHRLGAPEEEEDT